MLYLKAAWNIVAGFFGGWSLIDTLIVGIVSIGISFAGGYVYATNKAETNQGTAIVQAAKTAAAEQKRIDGIQYGYVIAENKKLQIERAAEQPQIVYVDKYIIKNVKNPAICDLDPTVVKEINSVIRQ